MARPSPATWSPCIYTHLARARRCSCARAQADPFLVLFHQGMLWVRIPKDLRTELEMERHQWFKFVGSDGSNIVKKTCWVVVNLWLMLIVSNVLMINNGIWMDMVVRDGWLMVDWLVDWWLIDGKSMVNNGSILGNDGKWWLVDSKQRWIVNNSFYWWFNIGLLCLMTFNHG